VSVRPISRRRFLEFGAAGLVAASGGIRMLPAWALESLRQPGSRPDPSRPAGEPAGNIPIDHVVVVMMENHSFDNYLGMLPKRGRAAADGFTFDAGGRPTNTNPVAGGVIRAFRMPTECQMEHEPSQAWTATHTAVGRGAMSGFVEASGDVAMGYWDEADLPFYYSIAKTFPLANRWFASCPAQTYPNRRFLMAASSLGLIDNPVPGPTDPAPPNGTIFDVLNAHSVSWRNYFTDLPQTALFPYVVEHNPQHLAPIAQFFADAAGGLLPALSLVDPDFGALDVAGGFIPGQPAPEQLRAQGGDEENPQNVQIGEAFVAGVVNAVMQSPRWDRTALIWLYDEHGGYYDHVPPPAAVPPDAIEPKLGPKDTPGRFDTYGIRVPAVVISPWARPDYVSPVVHDHTSILKLIETKWNLPALTFRDANADDLLDFFDFSRPAFATPPALAPAANPARAPCSTADPNAPVEPITARAAGGGAGAAGGAGGRLPATGPGSWTAPMAGLAALATAWTARRATGCRPPAPPP
jgi:phospholipase C